MTFYITKETKKEVEDSINELQQIKETTDDTLIWNDCVSKQNIYKHILSNSVIIPHPNSTIPTDYIMD